MKFYILTKEEQLITGVKEQTEDGWLDCVPVHNPKNRDITEESIKATDVFGNPEKYEVSKNLQSLINQIN